MSQVQIELTGRSPLSGVEIKKIAHVCSVNEKKVNGVIEINFVSEKKIRELNKKFRGKDAVTDVLSFPMREGALVAGPVFGELYLCTAKIRRQAKEFGVKFREETARMMIHGILHLAGHDHIKKNEAKKMFTLQETILKKVNP